MKKVLRLCYPFLALVVLCCGAPSKKDATLTRAPVVDPLPSWNDGVLKTSIISSPYSPVVMKVAEVLSLCSNIAREINTLRFKRLLIMTIQPMSFFYQGKGSVSLAAAMKNKWNAVSMKNDWETVFATENNAL